MDDDFSFASVWGAPTTPSPITAPLAQGLAAPTDFPPSSSSSQGDDDFDDFGTARTEPSDAQDDDFGDFGDFGDAGEMGTAVDFGEDMAFSQEVHITGSLESEWEPLRLDPMPSKADLQRQVEEVLGTIWTNDISEFTTGEDIRQVEGVSQILVTPERFVTPSCLLISGLKFFSVANCTIHYFNLSHLQNRQTGRVHASASNILSPLESLLILMKYYRIRMGNHYHLYK
jgi:hypothetical protein